MTNRYIFTSLTRTSDLEENGFEPIRQDRKNWKNGDLVVCETKRSSERLRMELKTGRMVVTMKGDLLVGALGERFATLEATGSWKNVDESGEMNVLTGAGLFGKVTSKSPFLSNLIEVKYVGHCSRNMEPLNLMDFSLSESNDSFKTPVILIMGTSMSAGKTASARILIRACVEQGKRVVGSKLTGAGRYRDILTMKDAGAWDIIDFVDAGLPSSITNVFTYREALRKMLTAIDNCKADVAVIEIGASPLEPYNGELAFKAVKDNIICSVLCASDPYAVYGVMKGFGLKPDIVAGIATNTIAGSALIEKLCGIRTLNLIDEKNQDELNRTLELALSK